MKSFWNRGRSYDVEAALRGARPEPRDEFLTSLSAHVRAERRSARKGFRVALAGVLTIGLLAALAPVGAFGYASSAAKGIVSAAARVVSVQTRPAATKTPAQDQYGHLTQPKKCKKGTKRIGKKCVKVSKGTKGARVSRRGPHFTG
jgi:hypothetical protein